MHAHGVHVLHAANGDGVAGGVPHGLELDLLPAGDVLFHQDLGDGGGIQPGAGRGAHLFLIIGHTAAGAPQGEGGADDDGIADLLRDAQGGIHVFGDVGGNHRFADGLHRILEQLAVLGLVDGLHVGADQLHAVGFEKALLVQLHGHGQAGLAAQPRQHAVGLLLLDDALDGLHRQRLQVDLVRQGFVGHDGGRVAVHQHHVHPRRLQHPAGLGPGVVKLRRLPDDDGTGTDHENLLDIFV